MPTRPDLPEGTPACAGPQRCVATRGDRPAGLSYCQRCGRTMVLGMKGWLSWDHEDKRDFVVQDEED